MHPSRKWGKKRHSRPIRRKGGGGGEARKTLAAMEPKYREKGEIKGRRKGTGLSPSSLSWEVEARREGNIFSFPVKKGRTRGISNPMVPEGSEKEGWEKVGVTISSSQKGKKMLTQFSQFGKNQKRSEVGK